MGQLGFGEQLNVRRHHIQQISEEPDQFVRFRQIDAAGSGAFPEIGRIIQADDAGAMGDIEQHDVEKLEQNIRIGKVHVDLFVCIGRPEVPFAPAGRCRHQDRPAARSDNRAEIRFRIG